MHAQLLGEWRAPAANAPLAPTAGLAYYLTPPPSLTHLLFTDPTHGCIHMWVVCLGCAFFAMKWVEMTGGDARVRNSPPPCLGDIPPCLSLGGNDRP